MDRITNFINKKFTNINTDLKLKIKKLIKEGTYYICEEPLCNHSWRAKPGEIVEKCEKCNSHRITLAERKDNRLKRIISLFSQDDWP